MESSLFFNSLFFIVFFPIIIYLLCTLFPLQERNLKKHFWPPVLNHVVKTLWSLITVIFKHMKVPLTANDVLQNCVRTASVLSHYIIPLLSHCIPTSFTKWEERAEPQPACWEVHSTHSLSYGCRGAHPWEWVRHVNLISPVFYLVEKG